MRRFEVILLLISLDIWDYQDSQEISAHPSDERSYGSMIRTKLGNRLRKRTEKFEKGSRKRDPSRVTSFSALKSKSKRKVLDQSRGKFTSEPEKQRNDELPSQQSDDSTVTSYQKVTSQQSDDSDELKRTVTDQKRKSPSTENGKLQGQNGASVKGSSISSKTADELKRKAKSPSANDRLQAQQSGASVDSSSNMKTTTFQRTSDPKTQEDSSVSSSREEKPIDSSDHGQRQHPTSSHNEREQGDSSVVNPTKQEHKPLRPENDPSLSNHGDLKVVPDIQSNASESDFHYSWLLLLGLIACILIALLSWMLYRSGKEDSDIHQQRNDRFTVRGVHSYIVPSPNTSDSWETEPEEDDFSD